jgi:hypothetical protein
MIKVFRASRLVTLNNPPLDDEGRAIPGYIGVQLLFYRREAAEKWVESIGGGTVDECYEQPHNAPDAPTAPPTPSGDTRSTPDDGAR